MAASSGLSALLMVAAAGASAYSQYQSGKAQNAISMFNANQQTLNAESQRNALQQQAAQQRNEAEANFLLQSGEATARKNNASAIEKQALVQDSINRQNLQKRRANFSEMQATQRANIAASGIVESSGTPLDLLSDTAAKIKQDQQEQLYAGEQKRETLFAEAYNERLGGKFAQVGATLDRNSGLAAASLNEFSAQQTYLSGLREAQISRMTGAAAESAGTMNAGATLLSGFGSAAGGLASSSLFTPKPKVSTGYATA